jgi:hypothetical protein
MARPKFFRDPVHGQIRYDAVDLGGPPRADRTLSSWLARKLIDCPEFQRLRHIRQNGLANLVFHGAEHSRFTHSMGAAFLAREMLDRIELNMDDPQDPETRAAVSAAALLHDVGHGPFSHALEGACRAAGVELHHERLSVRMILEDTAVHRLLAEVDGAFPERVAAFIDRSRRGADHWTYRLVSSQLDADRLDYMKRDAHNAGLQGYDFDLPRLVDCLEHVEGKRIAVHRRAMAAVELYLVALDKLYDSVYYHHAIRAATVLLESVLQRAAALLRDGDAQVIPSGSRPHPLRALLASGDRIGLPEYARLGEFQVWAMVDAWRDHADPVLADLSGRLLDRRLFKTQEFDPLEYVAAGALVSKAKDLARQALPFLDARTVDHYVRVDEPTRTSYKTYDWRAEAADESIWMTGGGRDPGPIENEYGAVVSALKKKRYFHRLVFPNEIREGLQG